mgnify:CR=1 FL=1
MEPQQIADSFVKVGEGIAGGFVAAQGALALFAEDNEELEKVMVRVQGAIAIAMGARAAAEAAVQGRIAARIAMEKLGITTTQGATVVQKIFNAVVKENPLILFVTLLVAAGAALLKYAAILRQGSAEQQIMNEVGERAASVVAEQRTEIDLLLRTAKDLDENTKDRRASIEKLNEIMGDYVGTITEENIQTEAVSDAIERYNELIEVKAQLDAAAAILTEKMEEKIKLQVEAQTGQNVSLLNQIGALTTAFEAQDLANAQTANAIAAIDEQTESIYNVIDALDAEKDALEANGAVQAKMASNREAHDERMAQVDAEREKRADESQSKSEERLSNDQDIINQLEQMRIDAIENDNARAIEQLQFDLRIEQERINNLNASEELKRELLVAAEQTTQDAISKIRVDAEEEARQLIADQRAQAVIDDFNSQKAALEAELILLDAESEERMQKEIALAEVERQIKLEQEGLTQGEIELIEAEHQARLNQIREDARQRDIENQAKVNEARRTLLETSFNTLRGIGEAFINDQQQLQEFNKAVAGAEIAINTAKAIGNVIAGATQAAAAGGPAAPFLIAGYVAQGLGAVFSAVAQAKQLLGGAGNIPTPSLGGGGGGAPPTFSSSGQLPNVPETTIQNNQPINITLPPIETQVSEQRISETQQRVVQLESAATL